MGDDGWVDKVEEAGAALFGNFHHDHLGLGQGNRRFAIGFICSYTRSRLDK